MLPASPRCSPDSNLRKDSMFTHRPRRLRQSAPMRNLVAQNRIAPADLILPVFVKEGIQQPIDISSMPGVQQHSMDSLKAAAHDAVAAGVGGIMLFGVPAKLDAQGTARTDPQCSLNVAIREVMAEVGHDHHVVADFGHDFSDGDIENALRVSARGAFSMSPSEKSWPKSAT